MDFDHEETPFAGPSKSARKRAAKAVEDLAIELVSLGKSKLSGLNLPEDIRKELELASTTKGHGSRKRQIKHLAGLLRKRVDLVEELGSFLAGSHQQQYDEKKLFHQLESLRDGLCDPARFEEALRQVKDRFPRSRYRKPVSACPPRPRRQRPPCLPGNLPPPQGRRKSSLIICRRPCQSFPVC